MTLADVYCRFNRARGMEVSSVLMNVEEELRFYMWYILCHASNLHIFISAGLS